MEMTLEQKRAIALAAARLRLQPPVAAPPEDQRSTGQVAWGQVGSLLKGAPKAVTAIPGMVGSGVSALTQMLSGGGSGKAQELIQGTVKGIAEPWITNARGINALKEAYGGEKAAPAPTQQEWESSAENVGMQGVSLLLPSLAKKGVSAAKQAPFAQRHLPQPQVKATQSLSRLAAPRIVKAGIEPVRVTAEIQPLIVEQMRNAGIRATDIPKVEMRPTEIVGDLAMGGSADAVAKASAYLGKPIDQLKALPLEFADAAVTALTNQTKPVFTQLWNAPAPTVVNSVYLKVLRQSKNKGLPAAVRAKWERMADEIKELETVGDLKNKLDWGNDAGKYDGAIPGNQFISEEAYGANFVANAIRDELYPYMETTYAVKGLREHGRLVSKAMDTRDGMYQTWMDAAQAQSDAMLTNFLGKIGYDVVRATYFGKAAALHAGWRIIKGETPLQTWYRHFRTAAADVGLKPSRPFIPGPQHATVTATPITQYPMQPIPRVRTGLPAAGLPSGQRLLPNSPRLLPPGDQ